MAALCRAQIKVKMSVTLAFCKKVCKDTLKIHQSTQTIFNLVILNISTKITKLVQKYKINTEDFMLKMYQIPKLKPGLFWVLIYCESGPSTLPQSAQPQGSQSGEGYGSKSNVTTHWSTWKFDIFYNSIINVSTILKI